MSCCTGLFVFNAKLGLSYIHRKKELVGPTNGLLINNLFGVLNQHMLILGIVMITM